MFDLRFWGVVYVAVHLLSSFAWWGVACYAFRPAVRVGETPDDFDSLRGREAAGFPVLMVLMLLQTTAHVLAAEIWAVVVLLGFLGPWIWLWLIGTLLWRRFSGILGRSR